MDTSGHVFYTSSTPLVNLVFVDVLKTSFKTTGGGRFDVYQIHRFFQLPGVPLKNPTAAGGFGLGAFCRHSESGRVGDGQTSQPKSEMSRKTKKKTSSIWL